MASICNSRLRKEYQNLLKNPIENIRAAPKETNILEWHYVLQGAKGTSYEGGVYHGLLVFPPQYPHKPPSIQMLTPNGRFKTATRLCLSMSDFHPESWNPMWSVGTILMGLYSFMAEETPTQGSIVSSASARAQAAADSLEFNCKNPTFCELFPEMVELRDAQLLEKAKAAPSPAGTTITQAAKPALPLDQSVPWGSLLAVLAAIVACTWAIFALCI